MLVPVIAARDRWLKPSGVMIPSSVTASTALVHDSYVGDMVGFLRDDPYGLNLQDLVERTVNEVIYAGTFRHLAAGDRRSESSPLWTTNAGSISFDQAQAPHVAEVQLAIRDHGTGNALALWFSADLAPGISLSIGPGDPPTHWGMTTAPLRSPVELAPGMVVRARVRTALAQPVGTWTSWAIVARPPPPPRRLVAGDRRRAQRADPPCSQDGRSASGAQTSQGAWLPCSGWG